MGWVVGRHGALYAQEHGYDRTFEGLVASVVGEFVAGFDPARALLDCGKGRRPRRLDLPGA
jgi:hypothetical protein